MIVGGIYYRSDRTAQTGTILSTLEVTFHWLNVAYQERDTRLERLKVDPGSTLFTPTPASPTW